MDWNIIRQKAPVILGRYPVAINYRLTLEQMTRAAGLESGWWDHAFDRDGVVELETVLLEFKDLVDVNDVLIRLKRHRLRPARIEELLATEQRFSRDLTSIAVRTWALGTQRLVRDDDNPEIWHVAVPFIGNGIRLGRRFKTTSLGYQSHQFSQGIDVFLAVDRIPSLCLKTTELWGSFHQPMNTSWSGRKKSET